LLAYENHENSKHQNTNLLSIVCNLSIVIWDFSAVSGKANRFYLNQLELTLTFPCYIPFPAILIWYIIISILISNEVAFRPLFQNGPFQNGMNIYKITDLVYLCLTHMPNWHNRQVKSNSKKFFFRKTTIIYLFDFTAFFIIIFRPFPFFYTL